MLPVLRLTSASRFFHTTDISKSQSFRWIRSTAPVSAHTLHLRAEDEKLNATLIDYLQDVLSVMAMLRQLTLQKRSHLPPFH
jgi:hypothetical protein